MRFVLGILIASALGVITNLISNYLAPAADKRRRFVWTLFAALVFLSVSIALIPDDKKLQVAEADNPKILLVDAVDLYSVWRRDSEEQESVCRSRIRIANLSDVATSLSLSKTKVSFGEKSGTMVVSDVSNPASIDDMHFEGNVWIDSVPSINSYLDETVTRAIDRQRFPVRIAEHSSIDLIMDVIIYSNPKVQILSGLTVKDKPADAIMSRDVKRPHISVSHMLIFPDSPAVTTEALFCMWVNQP